MKRNQYGPEQIVKILQEHEAGVKCADLCRKCKMSDATFYSWKAKCANMTIAEAQCLKSMEAENGRLKRIVADMALDNAMLNARRQMCACRGPDIGFRCPQRRVFKAMGVSRRLISDGFEHESDTGRHKLMHMVEMRGRPDIIVGKTAPSSPTVRSR